MDTTLGSRLRDALKLRGKSPSFLYRGVSKVLSKAGIYNILDDKTTADKIRDSTVRKICAALDVNEDWLLTGKGPIERIAFAPSDWPDIKAYRAAASLGEGAVPDDYAETHSLKFRSDSLRRKRLNPEKLGVVYGRGDSMLPRIHDGDAIMFDMRRKEPEDGALFVVTYDGVLLAKRLSNLGGRWFIESLNKDDPKWRKPRPIDDHRGFEIHGRVVWIGSWEN